MGDVVVTVNILLVVVSMDVPNEPDRVSINKHDVSFVNITNNE
jgi:hypothetical protein